MQSADQMGSKESMLASVAYTEEMDQWAKLYHILLLAIVFFRVYVTGGGF